MKNLFYHDSWKINTYKETNQEKSNYFIGSIRLREKSDKLIESKLTYIIFWMHPYYCTYVHNTVKGVSKMNICNLIYGFMESN